MACSALDTSTTTTEKGNQTENPQDKVSKSNNGVQQLDAPKNTASGSVEWTSTDVFSMVTTVVLGLFLLVVGVFSSLIEATLPLLSITLLAGSCGGLGGLVHEISQSGGKILFYQKHEDGIYLGSVAGILLGAAAGILLLRGYLNGDVTAYTAQIAFESFLAGLALKGVFEATGGNVVAKKGKDGDGQTPTTGSN